jgi:Uncharacterized protein conserved in bacteria
MSKTTEIVWNLARPAAEKCGCEIWDVEYVKEAGSWYLRIYIDKENGVSIEDCEAMSRELDPILDEADPIQESYIFEVSSAGAERELKRPSDFERFIGSNVELKLYKGIDGQKQFVGTLKAYKDGDVTISTAEDDMVFEKSRVALVRLRII